jgi:hypothetical protein
MHSIHSLYLLLSKTEDITVKDGKMYQQNFGAET